MYTQEALLGPPTDSAETDLMLFLWDILQLSGLSVRGDRDTERER